MSLQIQHEENKGIRPLPSQEIKTWEIEPKEWEKAASKPFSSTCLPNPEVLHHFRVSKHRGNPKIEATGLTAFGSFKFVKLQLPYFEHGVSAGYPTDVGDPFTRHLDLSRYLIRHPKSTYYFKASGYSMSKAGINDKDLLVVDTALKPKHRDIVIAVLNGAFIVKRYSIEDSQIKLVSANPDYPPIVITNEMDFFIQGVVTTVIRTFNPLPYDNHFKDISYPNT